LVLLTLLVDPLSPPVLLTVEQDHQRIMDLLHIVSLRIPRGSVASPSASAA
jgi:hypothetical protein